MSPMAATKNKHLFCLFGTQEKGSSRKKPSDMKNHKRVLHGTASPQVPYITKKNESLSINFSKSKTARPSMAVAHSQESRAPDGMREDAADHASFHR